MNATWTTAWLCVLFFVSTGVTPIVKAKSLEESKSQTSLADGISREVKVGEGPRVIGELYPRTERRLRQAFPVAVQRVRDRGACRDLFAGLSADGLELLTNTFYFNAASPAQCRVCMRRVDAFTHLRSARTILCRSFGSLSVNAAAHALIHEALHFAGLSEAALDRRAMDSREIDRLVKKSCGL